MRGVLILVVVASGCVARQASVCSPQQAYAEGQQLGATGRPMESASAASRCGNSVDFNAGWQAGRQQHCKPETLYNAGFATGLSGEAMTYFERFFICGSDEPYKEYYRGYSEGVDRMCKTAVDGAFANARTQGSLGKPAPFAANPKCGDAHNVRLASESERGHREGIAIFCSTLKLGEQGVSDGKAGATRLDIAVVYPMCGGGARKKLQAQYTAGYKAGLAKFCSADALEQRGRADGEAGRPRSGALDTCGKRKRAAYVRGYEAGVELFCKKGSSEAQGRADGEAGRPQANIAAQFGMCSARERKRIAAEYADAYDSGLAKLCSKSAMEARGRGDGEAGRAQASIEAKYAACGRSVRDHYQAGYDAGLATYCSPARLAIAATREVGSGAARADLPAMFAVCVARLPRVRDDYEAAFAQARDKHVANACTFEAGVSAGNRDALASNTRKLDMPTFCDRQRFARYQNGYLDGWKQTKANLCSEVEASQRGVADAKAGRPISYQPPSSCPADMHSGMLAAYRDGYKSVPEPTPATTPAPASTTIGWRDDAKAYRGRHGTRLTFVCPAGSTTGVWGTDVYSDDSSICSAAVHAGAITSSGGTVTIEVRPGESLYRGSQRNGLRSNDYGSWAGSFIVLGATAQPTPTTPATSITWRDDAKQYRGRHGTRLTFSCSAGSTTGVWGSDVYSDDSSICSAAVHAGVITAGGGTVTIEIRAGESAYVGATRNGVRSSDYGSWGGSFVVIGAPPSSGADVDDDDDSANARLRCVEWADEKYRRGLLAAEARDRANARCRGVRDLEIAKWAYDVASRGMLSTEATDVALDAAARPKLRKKLELLRYVVEQYQRALLAGEALQRGLTGVEKLPKNAKPCVTSNFEAYNRSMLVAEAMDRAIAQCQ